MTDVWRRLVSAIGLGGLAALALAYWLTYEPAPAVRVRWRDDVSAERQADLERKYQLSNGRAPMGRSIAYDLLDTRRSNIEALVHDPAVADTHDIDRDRYEVPFEAAYGDEWMWIAHRIPVLRDSRVRWVLITVLSLFTLAGQVGIRKRGTQRGVLANR